MDFDILKRSYTATIQYALLANISYAEAKRGNEMLYEFFKTIVELSNYSDYDKNSIKNELELIKETLSQEIEKYFA